MKTSSTIALLVIVSALASCRMSRGAAESNASVRNGDAANIDTTIAATPPVPLMFPSQLIKFAMEDLAGTNQRLKDTVIEVSGEVTEVASGSVVFQPALSQRVHCQGDLDYERSETLRKAADDFLLKRTVTKPIARVRGTYRYTSVSEFTTPYKGTDVQVFLELCEIVTVTL